MAVIRELQVNRQTDIVTLRGRLNAKNAERQLVSALTALRNAKAIDGESKGKDPANGYPYKHWMLVNDEAAKRVARHWQIRLMPPDGKQHIIECAK